MTTTLAPASQATTDPALAPSAAPTIETSSSTLEVDQLVDVWSLLHRMRRIKIHNSPSTLVARVTKLDDALKEAKKRYQDASDSVKEKTRQVEEHQKSLPQEIEARAKDPQDEVADMKHALCDSVQ
ncbi:unnamed protein product [Vicia faba]|uniref:Tubulin-specific chaperone A n=1 Tax=Vicia faba TaxID=3906 RepID=A0AAV1A7J8_VICFA|nr:unnamed protein product [Vicia faba]